MLKKRILALACAFACVITSVNAAPLFTDVPEDSNEERVLNVITGVGLMKGYEDGSFMPREAVKRGEIAQILCNALSYEYEVSDEQIEWDDEYLGDDSKDTELIVAENKESRWNDVPKNNWAYKAIEQIAAIGIMAGDGNGNFRPEDTVTYNEAIKVILNLCGYEKEAGFFGGYPDGYAKIATENGMYKGISGTGDSKMSRMDIARLFYNSFELPVREYKYNGTGFVVTPDDEESFMNDKMDVYAVTGALTQTDVTSVDSDVRCEKGEASLNGFKFQFDDDKAAIRDYIGREIRIFVHKNEDEDYELLCWEETGKDKITVIDAADFEKFEDNTFSYEANGKIKNIKVDEGFSLIYNGKYLGTYADEDFDFENGTITVIDSKNFDVDTVVVENYKSGYISVINSKDMFIIDKLAEGSQNAVIDFEPDDGDIFYSIYDSIGNVMNFEELGTGAMNYIYNGDYIKIYFSSNKTSGQVTSVNKRDDGEFVKIDDVEYKIAKEYIESKNYIPLSSGMQITVFVDAWGNVAWITNNTGIGNVGYLTRAYNDEENDEHKLKFFDFTKKSQIDVKLSDKVRYYDKFDEVTRMTGEGVVTQMSDYKGVFSYECNSDGEIKEIKIPLDSKVSSNDLRLRIMNSGTFWCNSVLGSLSDTFLSSDTQVLLIPPEPENYEDYKFAGRSYFKKTNYSCSIYNFDKRSKLNKVVVVNTNSDLDGRISQNSALWVVTEVNTIYDEEDMVSTPQFTVCDGANIKVLTPDTSLCDFNGVNNQFGKGDADGNKYTVGVGDLVKYEELNGKVINLQLVYDADGKNPAWYGADPADKTTVVPSGNEDYSSVLGSIPGSTGFNANKDNASGYFNTNPVNYSYDIPTAGKKTFGNGDCRYIYGFAYSEYEDYITITTQNLHGRFDDEIEKENYYTEAFNPAGADVVLIKGSGNRIGVEKGKISDIRTYEQSGSKCSKIWLCHGSNYSTGRIFVWVD